MRDMPECFDVRCVPYMPLHVERLKKSRSWLRCKRNPALGFYLMNLWMRAWHELPAGSIENDDDVLADAAECAPDDWAAVKSEVLCGWEEYDGRLYHPVILEVAAEAANKIKVAQLRTDAARKARSERAKKNVKNQCVGSVTETVTETVTEQLQGPEGKGREGKEAASAASAGAVATPASPKRDRAWVLALEDRLRAAAGLENDPSPNLSVIGPITGLMDAGADLEVDILPVIRARAKSGAKPRSWSFFTGAIQDAMKARHAAGEPLVVRREPPGETHAEKRKRLGMPDPETRDLGWWKPKVETFYRCREWVDWMCGPPPGDPGCLAPQEWIDMYRPKPRIVA